MEGKFSEQDLRENSAWAALGYIVFFLPLWQRPDSRLGRYCANQGLIVTVLMVLVSILFSIFTAVPLIGWIFRIAGGLACLALLGVQLLCFVQLMTFGRVIELPFVGAIRLLPGIEEKKDDDSDRW